MLCVALLPFTITEPKSSAEEGKAPGPVYWAKHVKAEIPSMEHKRIIKDWEGSMGETFRGGVLEDTIALK